MDPLVVSIRSLGLSAMAAGATGLSFMPNRTILPLNTPNWLFQDLWYRSWTGDLGDVRQQILEHSGVPSTWPTY